MRQALGDAHLGDRHVAHVDGRWDLQQIADRRRQHGGGIDRAGILQRGLAQPSRRRGRTEAMTGLVLEPGAQVLGGAPIPLGGEQAGEQLLGRFAGIKLEAPPPPPRAAAAGT